MNKLRRTGAVIALSLILTITAFAGTIHYPGVVDPPPPPPSEEESTSTTTATTSTTTDSITTDVILTILSLISFR